MDIVKGSTYRETLRWPSGERYKHKNRTIAYGGC